MRGNRLGGPARTTPIARATMPPRTSPKDAWGWAAGRHAVRPPGAMDKIERAVDDIRRKWAPDSRLAVFEISLLPKGVAGVTSSRDARDALRRLAGESQLVEKVELIPDGVVAPAAIVTAALAPLMGEPRVSAPRATEALHGEVLEVLEQRAEWLRVRAPDGYIAWLNTG